MEIYRKSKYRTFDNIENEKKRFENRFENFAFVRLFVCVSSCRPVTQFGDTNSERFQPTGNGGMGGEGGEGRGNNVRYQIHCQRVVNKNSMAFSSVPIRIFFFCEKVSRRKMLWKFGFENFQSFQFFKILKCTFVCVFVYT